MVAFPAAESFPTVLPVSSRGAFGVQQVISDLERRPKVAAICGQQMALGHRDAPENGAGFSAELDQPAGLERLQPGDLLRVERLAPSVAMSIIWPPTIPRAPTAAPKRH